jgi:LmbE family N-acetylglucosaminyl deacetylase
MKVLIVAPHPDDETFWMGGTIMKLKDQGHDIHVLLLTLGEKSWHPNMSGKDLKEIRKEEVLQAARMLRIDTLQLANLPDTELRYEDTYNVVKQCIQKEKPDRVYIPHNPDHHQDHMVASNASKMAAIHENIREILIYDSGLVLHPMNYYEDISDLLEEKLKICNVFGSQVIKNHLSTERIRSRALTRGNEVKTTAAEAFYIVRLVS